MRRSPSVLVIVACVLLTACGDPCPPELTFALEKVRARVPTFRAGKEARDRVLLEAHGTASLTGFGATLVEVEHLPGLDGLIPHDVPAQGPLDRPSLLFFEKTSGPDDEWPLIGVGYHRPFTPCDKPVLDEPGIDDDDWYVHEAGWHHVPIGDGGFTAATPANVRVPANLDEAGCREVPEEDVGDLFPFIKHGRAWTVHVWLPDARGECPVVALTDPWGRTDCVERTSSCTLPWESTCEPSLDVQGRAFFPQGDCSALCGAP